MQTDVPVPFTYPDAEPDAPAPQRARTPQDTAEILNWINKVVFARLPNGETPNARTITTRWITCRLVLGAERRHDCECAKEVGVHKSHISRLKRRFQRELEVARRWGSQQTETISQR